GTGRRSSTTTTSPSTGWCRRPDDRPLWTRRAGPGPARWWTPARPAPGPGRTARCARRTTDEHVPADVAGRAAADGQPVRHQRGLLHAAAVPGDPHERGPRLRRG